MGGSIATKACAEALKLEIAHKIQGFNHYSPFKKNNY